MALPFSFSNNPTPTGPQLDACLAALGNVGVIPCTMTGSSNALVVTPLNSAPTVIFPIPSLQVFSAVSTAFNTGPVTVTIGALNPPGPLPVYVDDERGPTVLQGGEIATNNAVLFMYDGSLNSGSGGFHLLNPTQQSVLSNTIVVNSNTGTTLSALALTAGVFRQSIINRTGTASGGFNDTTDTAANILADLTGAIATVSTFRFRYFNNGTGQTATIVGGTNVTVNGPATIANNASHDFIGVMTAVSPTPMVSIWG